MAQRNAPHFERAVFQQQRVLGRVHLGPDHRIGQLAVEKPQVAGQYLAERRRGEYPQRGFAPVERQRRDQRKESEDMVAVQVRDEHGAQFQRVDPAADQLLLYPLSRIDQIVLLVHIDRLGRRMAAQGGLGGGRSEYGDAETHAWCLFCSFCVIRFTLRGSG